MIVYDCTPMVQVCVRPRWINLKCASEQNCNTLMSFVETRELEQHLLCFSDDCWHLPYGPIIVDLELLFLLAGMSFWSCKMSKLPICVVCSKAAKSCCHGCLWERRIQVAVLRSPTKDDWSSVCKAVGFETDARFNSMNMLTVLEMLYSPNVVQMGTVEVR